MRAVIRLFVVCALLALAGCGGKPSRGAFRDAGLSVYSSTVVQPGALAGNWQQAAGFQRPNNQSCGAGQVQFGAVDGAGRIPVALNLCLSGRSVSYRGLADVTGPGRLRLSGADPQGIGQEWWILWADVDMRTLAVGTPSGDFGFVLNRGGALPVDRLNAAREVLDFNGYDLTKLRVF
jgi:apolipoprotein D and lipocalin family protein